MPWILSGSLLFLPAKTTMKRINQIACCRLILYACRSTYIWCAACTVWDLSRAFSRLLATVKCKAEYSTVPVHTWQQKGKISEHKQERYERRMFWALTKTLLDTYFFKGVTQREQQSHEQRCDWHSRTRPISIIH